MAERKIQYKPLTYNHKTMLRRRGLNPDNYVLIKSTYVSLYLRDRRDGSIKIITKNN